VSKTDDFKNKIRKGSRDARSELMGSETDGNVNINVNINDDVNINNNENVNNDFLNQLVRTKPKKKSDSLINSGVYFEEEVFSILMDLAKKGGRGAKSRIVNDALKVAFKNAGLMD